MSTLIDWLMKKLGQDYEARIANLQEGLRTMANLHGQECEISRSLRERLKSQDELAHMFANQLGEARDLAHDLLVEHLKVEMREHRPFTFQLRVELSAIAFRLGPSSKKQVFECLREEMEKHCGNLENPLRNQEIRAQLDRIIDDVEQILDHRTKNNGMDRDVDPHDSRSVRVFGMDIPTILEFRRQYLRHNGAWNITPETVRTFFRERCDGSR